MIRPLFLLLLIATLGACTAGHDTTSAAKPDPFTQRADSFLRQCQAAGFNGSVLVVRNDSALLDKGYGLRDRERVLPNTPATVHAIGSITKQFTAACILKLQDQGRLDVNDPMSRYVKDVPPDKSTITIHQLLTHSAGFPDAIGDDYAAIDRDGFLRLAMSTPLKFTPGQGYNYSNVGYSILGAIVEQLSGRSYERYLHDELLVPAGISRTGYLIPDWSKEELAIGYRKDGERWGTMWDHPWAVDGPYWHLRCNGGLLSTTHDMTAWVDALREGKMLSKTATDAMFTPHVREGEGADSFYGYGWAIFSTPRGTRLITHNGGNGIQFADVLWYADEGVKVVLMSNANARGMQDLAWELGRMVFDPAYVPRVPTKPEPLASPPQGPMGDRLLALSRIIGSSGSDEELKSWFANNFGPGFLHDMPMEQHLAVFKRLRADLGPNTIASLERSGEDEFVLHLVGNKDHRRFRMLVQLRPSDALISGIGVEQE